MGASEFVFEIAKSLGLSSVLLECRGVALSLGRR